MNPEVIKALLALLAQGPPLGLTFYTYLPQGNQTYPVGRVGDVTTEAMDTDSSEGARVTVPLHVLSKYKGDKEAGTLMGLVRDRVHHADLAVTGATTVSCYVDRMELLPTEEQGSLREGVVYVVVSLDDIS